MSYNEHINEDFIRKYIDKPWHWKDLIDNKAVTKKLLIDFPDKLWPPESQIIVTTINDYKNGTNKYWNQYRFSKDPELTIEDLKRYHDKDWIWEDVCKNPNLKIDDLYLFKKPFDCFRYVLNPNLNIPSFSQKVNKHSADAVRQRRSLMFS